MQAVIDGKASTRKPAPERPRPASRRVDLVIDIQERMCQSKGPTYERWAKIYNLRQMYSRSAASFKSHILVYLHYAPIPALLEIHILHSTHCMLVTLPKVFCV